MAFLTTLGEGEKRGEAMHVSEEYFKYVTGQLADVREVGSRKMFGGYGLYSGGVMFGLVAENRFYLKTDQSNRSDYEEAGMGPFMPHFATRPGRKPAAMPYHEVPPEVVEAGQTLVGWAQKSVAVARATAKPKRKKQQLK